jgi:hypothetical protein
MVHEQMPSPTDPRQGPDENPFRVYSARNVLVRARERIQLIRHWLIRHDMRELDSPSRDTSKINGKDRG